MQEHFYHGLTKKYISAFGSLFNDITLVRYNNARTAERKRTKVPLVWGPREKYLTIKDDRKGVQIVLPIMSYNLIGFTYDPSRKMNSLLRHPKANTVTGNADTVYTGVPYNLDFQVSILSRNKEDAFQILEQIIPSFQPNYTFSQILIPEIGFVKDISVTLNGTNINIDEDSDYDQIIQVEITLNFTMQVHYYGPVSRTKVIKRAFANTFIDPALSTGAIIRVNVSNGNNGTYQLEDIVYQGRTLAETTAAGIVSNWNANNAYLIIGGVQGTFKTNETIKAASSNAEYTLASFDMSPLKTMSIKIEPDPIDAEPGEPFGFDETLIEYPDTIE